MDGSGNTGQLQSYPQHPPETIERLTVRLTCSSSGGVKVDTIKAVMVDVQICFFLLDESPCVGLFHKDSDGYGYCDDCMVAEPNGHPIF